MRQDCDLFTYFDTCGHYWLTNGNASIDLGEHETAVELADAIRVAVGQGPDCDWSGWGVEFAPIDRKGTVCKLRLA
jgi:hypothetical protein